MSKDNVAEIKRAASHIDATDLGNGRWAHYADETSRWWIVTEDELAELCEYLDSDDEQIAADAYSHWCAGTDAVEMPSGWSPGSARFGFEARTDGQWSAYAAGTQGDSNYFDSREEAEAELPRLAASLDCDVADVRVVEVV